MLCQFAEVATELTLQLSDCAPRQATTVSSDALPVMLCRCTPKPTLTHISSSLEFGIEFLMQLRAPVEQTTRFRAQVDMQSILVWCFV